MRFTENSYTTVFAFSMIPAVFAIIIPLTVVKEPTREKLFHRLKNIKVRLPFSGTRPILTLHENGENSEPARFLRTTVTVSAPRLLPSLAAATPAVSSLAASHLNRPMPTVCRSDDMVGFGRERRSNPVLLIPRQSNSSPRCY
jgi:hypothetical protein